MSIIHDRSLKLLSDGISPKKKGKFRNKIKQAEKSFFAFCCLKAPDFYKPEREYLKKLCGEMQAFYEDKEEQALIINLPPRHGKSRTATLFTQWIFGQNPSEKIMTGSYNETLSTTFSKAVRNGISERKATEKIIVYSDIFPNISIKRGDGAMNLWSLEGQYSSYLATSPSGTATGFGASVLIIDDLIKNRQEACNEIMLENHWSWFTDTMLSRLEEHGKIIIIMTRWASGDLAGRATKHFEETDIKYRLLTMKAMQEDGSMLCDEVLSKESYLMKLQTMSPEIASANYQQIPLDLKGRLYAGFKTYEKMPEFQGIYCYTDTADEGSDYLCSFIFGVYNREAYIIDTTYTQTGMEVTEKIVARKLSENNVGMARIESNNGGSGFARSIIRILQQELKDYRPQVKWFHQSKNKNARILSNAFWVTEHVYFPANWNIRWAELYRDLNRYQREGRNLHDDCADALTGVAETVFMIYGD